MLFLTLQLVLNSEDTTVLIDRPDEARPLFDGGCASSVLFFYL